MLGLSAQTETSSLLTPNAAVARKCCSESLLVRRSCVGLRRLSRIPHIWTFILEMISFRTSPSAFVRCLHRLRGTRQVVHTGRRLHELLPDSMPCIFRQWIHAPCSFIGCDCSNPMIPMVTDNDTPVCVGQGSASKLTAWRSTCYGVGQDFRSASSWAETSTLLPPNAPLRGTVVVSKWTQDQELSSGFMLSTQFFHLRFAGTEQYWHPIG